MKKKIASMLAAVAVVSMLAGCSNKYEQVLIGEWAAFVGASSADMTIKSDGTYSTYRFDGTWSITNDGVLSSTQDWLDGTVSSVANVEIIDNDTIKVSEGDYYTYLYRVGGTLPQKTYMSPALVTSFNSTAASIENIIDAFLTDCDVRGYGMKEDDTCVSEITISVTEGAWEITNSNTNAFKNGSLSWYGSGSGRASDFKSSASSAENMLAIELANLFPTIQNASVKAYLEGGDCIGVVYVGDTSVMPAGVPDFEDFQRGSFEWSGDIDGTTSDDIAVGTAPFLE